MWKEEGACAILRRVFEAGFLHQDGEGPTVRLLRGGEFRAAVDQSTGRRNRAEAVVVLECVQDDGATDRVLIGFGLLERDSKRRIIRKNDGAVRYGGDHLARSGDEPELE